MITTRRQLFQLGAQGIGATALLSLLKREGLVHAAPAHSSPHTSTQSAAQLPHIPAKARRVIQICLVGGLSHLDSFDYKPELEKLHGKSLGSSEKPDIFFGQVGLLRKSDFAFRQRGESGLWMSDLFPHIAACADDLSIVRSMVSDSANHTPALFVANSGFQFNGYPSMGSWIVYGLGSETDSLPSYVVLPDTRGGPNGGSSNWSSGFLPAQHQGVVISGGKQPVRDLFPSGDTSADADVAARDFAQLVNRRHMQRTGHEGMFEARLHSYELAAKMQLSVPSATDLSMETQATQEMYGLDQPTTADAGRRCLLGRRLLEQGVRFVQIFSGGPIGGSPRASWDAHENVKENHTAEAARIDQPVAALLKDLKQRGMLDDTLVLFTTEFGRTPFAQSAANQVGPGRDHNRYAFSIWMAGAGLKPGITYGSTDEIGWKAAENPVPWHDLHATILHQLGIRHDALTYYHNGIQRRLTNVHGHVLNELLA